MPIKMSTPGDAVKESIDRFIKTARQELIIRLAHIGEQVVNEARSYNGKAYQDQTGNLRSSTGYVIVEDGRVIDISDFSQIPPKSDPKGEAGKGSDQGKAYARRLAAGYPQGITLIVVAGMQYAAYVSARGYNVLDSAEAMARRLVPEMLKKLTSE